MGNGRPKQEMVGVQKERSGGKMNGGHFDSGSMSKVQKVAGRVMCAWEGKMSGSEGVGAHGLSKAGHGGLVLRGAIGGRGQAMRGSLTPSFVDYLGSFYMRGVVHERGH